MSSGALFSNNASRGSSKYLVEFKAGKMTMKGKMVYPDSRKGQVYVYQSDDSLMHFCWKDRTTGVVEDDLIIFPDDCEFKHVPQCETGRVYLLRFKSTSRRFFFWLQDLKTDKDKEHCRKINEVLNNPPTQGSHRSGGTNSEGDLQNLLSNMSQEQLMLLFGGVGQIGGLGTLLGSMNRTHGQRARTTTASTPVTTTAARPPAAQTPAPTTVTESPKPAGTRTAGSNLLGTITPSNTIHLSHLQSFLSGMPDQGSSEPAAQSGQAGPVIRQFGLGPDAVSAAASGNLEEFVNAVESEVKFGQAKQQQEQQSGGSQQQQQESEADDEKSKEDKSASGSTGGSSAKKDDDDGGMALD